jgi:hypothetical protein
MPSKALVVDANILVRGVLGTRARKLIETYAEHTTFLVPEAAVVEAEEHLAALVVRRGGDPEKALTLLRALSGLMEQIGSEVYGEFETVARKRLAAARSGGAEKGAARCPKTASRALRSRSDTLSRATVSKIASPFDRRRFTIQFASLLEFAQNSHICHGLLGLSL